LHDSIPRLRLHWDVDVMLGGEFDRARVTGIGVAKDAQSRIACQNPLETVFGIFSAVGNNDHAGMLRKTKRLRAG